jgi:hypothetical protein
MNTVALGLTQLLPGFVQGTLALRDALMLPAMLLCLAGVGMRFLTNGDLKQQGMTVLRLVIVTIVIANMPAIGNHLQQLATAVTNATGFNIQFNMLQDYQQALATKFNIVTNPNNSQPWQWLFNAPSMAAISILGVILYVGSVLACCMMFLVSIVQQILLFLEVAVSPLFLACIMVPALIPLATRFSTWFVAVCMFPLGFRIVDLLMKAVLDIVINTGNNPAIGAVNICQWHLAGLSFCGR